MEKELMKFIRNAAGLNQEQFAKRLSYSKCYIGYLEQGLRPISPLIEQKILNTFSITKEEYKVYKMLQGKRK